MNLQCTHAHTGLRPSDAFQAVNFDLKYTHIPIPSGRLWGRYEGCGGRGGADCRHWDCRLEPKAPNAISLIQLQALCRCVCVWERDSKTVSIYSVCVILTVKESREIIRYRNQNLSVLPKHWEKPRRAEGEKRSSRQTDRQTKGRVGKQKLPLICFGSISRVDQLGQMGSRRKYYGVQRNVREREVERGRERGVEGSKPTPGRD